MLVLVVVVAVVVVVVAVVLLVLLLLVLVLLLLSLPRLSHAPLTLTFPSADHALRARPPLPAAFGRSGF